VKLWWLSTESSWTPRRRRTAGRMVSRCNNEHFGSKQNIIFQGLSTKNFARLTTLKTLFNKPSTFVGKRTGDRIPERQTSNVEVKLFFVFTYLIEMFSFTHLFEMFSCLFSTWSKGKVATGWTTTARIYTYGA